MLLYQFVFRQKVWFEVVESKSLRDFYPKNADYLENIVALENPSFEIRISTFC